ncbi:Leucine-rich repeat serine/threonine-protein kinase 2 [Ceratobasidium sp. 428]|nr:Leucine-rich repeat serine/threonine-protein kinase 2 [Ceratobasidium sp. 428]
MRWAAPEILKGQETPSRAGDVYALGMTLIEVITGAVPFSNKGDTAVAVSVVVQKLIPERPKTFPSFTQDEAEQLWRIVVDSCAHNASDRPDSRTIQRRLQHIRQRIIQPSAVRSVFDSISRAIVTRLTGGKGERGAKNEVQSSIIGEAKTRFLHLSRSYLTEETAEHEGRECEEEYTGAAASHHSSQMNDQVYDVRPDPIALASCRQSASAVSVKPVWTSPPLQSVPVQQAAYYTQEAFGADVCIEPRTQPQMPLSPPLNYAGGYRLPPTQGYFNGLLHDLPLISPGHLSVISPGDLSLISPGGSNDLVRVYQCDICGLKLRRPGLLDDHLNTHVGLRRE